MWVALIVLVPVVIYIQYVFLILPFYKNEFIFQSSEIHSGSLSYIFRMSARLYDVLLLLVVYCCVSTTFTSLLKKKKKRFSIEA